MFNYQVRYFLQVIKGNALSRERCEYFATLKQAKEFIAANQNKEVSILGGSIAVRKNFVILDKLNNVIG